MTIETVNFMRHEWQKSLLVQSIRKVASEVDLYATLFLSESWLMLPEQHAVLVEQRRSGAHPDPGDIAGRREIVMLSLETHTAQKLRGYEILRNSAGEPSVGPDVLDGSALGGLLTNILCDHAPATRTVLGVVPGPGGPSC